MQAYIDYDKRLNITDMITYRTPIKYDLIKQMIVDDRLDDYDLFEVVDNSEYTPYIFYRKNEGKFFIIRPIDRSIGEFKEEDLKKNTYIICLNGTRMYENSVQDFKRRSDENFEDLTDNEKIQVILGEYFGLQVSETLKGLKDTLSDIIDLLKEEKGGDCDDN